MFDPIELDAVSMKVLDSRKNYLLQRLNDIIAERNPEENEEIRNQFRMMQAEALAFASEETESA